MASIGFALRSIKSQLSRHVPPSLVQNVCRQVHHRWRQRILDPLSSVHLLLLQLLSGVALISLHQVSKMSVSAAAVCKARMRLPVGVLARLVESIAGHAEGTQEMPLWKGLFRVVLVDATTCLSEDTLSLAREFGKAANQKNHKRPAGYPKPKLLALFDLTSGMIHKILDLPHARHELTLLSRMFAVLRAGKDLLLGDRGMVSYAHLALLQEAGLEGCFGLPRGLVVQGRGAGRRRRLARLGKQDLLVRWDKPARHTLSWMSRRRWQQLPASLVLRQIGYRICRRGYRTQWLWVLTTLSGPRRYAAQEIVALYERRWQVEVYFRDLKRTLRMQKFSARTVDGVRREMLAFVLLYNLVRRVMLEAADRQGVPPDRLSFADALAWLRWSQPGEALAVLRVNPRRQRATEPRRRKHGGYLFPVLNAPRQTLRKPRAKAVI